MSAEFASVGLTAGQLGSTEVEITKLRKPDQFFKDSEGSWVSTNFRSNIAGTKAVAVGTKFRLDSHEITKEGGATDAENEKALATNGNHLFDINNLAAIIAELISVQEGGKEGILLSNGYTNLFYTSSLVVNVHWVAGTGEWCVFTWRRDGRRWGQGDRAFVPGN